MKKLIKKLENIAELNNGIVDIQYDSKGRYWKVELIFYTKERRIISMEYKLKKAIKSVIKIYKAKI